MRFFHTDDGPLEYEIERVETVMDKGLVISWNVSCSSCTMYVVILNKNSRLTKKMRGRSYTDFYESEELDV